jgi:D-beta-D-heptose 7-phosphate kinase/D-beta-D-heptose 1-phosphate adenosyltransferase
MLTQKNVDCSGIFIENRPTTVKTRVIAHNQQVVRFDREDSQCVSGAVLRGIIQYIKSVRSDYDAVIVSDYKKGMVSRNLIRGILGNSRKSGRSGIETGLFVAVDPKIGHFDMYKGVSLITPNIMEASSGSRI